MIKKYLSLFLIFFITTPTLADFAVNIDNFEQFKHVTIKSNLQLKKNTFLRSNREENSQFISPDYFYSQDADNIYSWASDGYTLLKDEPSNDLEIKKLNQIQKDLKEVMGDEFDEKFSALNKIYQLIDVRYYAINATEESNKACISVRWISDYLNDTVNFCGFHELNKGGLSFEINEWSLNSGSGWSYRYFEQKDAWQLLEFALAALSSVYSIPENQQALLEALSKAK